MKIEELEVYNNAMQIGDMVWERAVKFDYFAKSTIGGQVIRSSDSIASNISEGEGVFHYGDKKRYLYYARGSAYETRTWLQKIQRRKLIDEKTFKNIDDMLLNVIRQINGTIHQIPKK